MHRQSDKMLTKLALLYGADRAPQIAAQLNKMIAETERRPQSYRLSEKDVLLITYGDQVRRAGQTPLQTLHAFARERLRGLINTIHILPFYPYSSDDGFSVIDYYAVDPTLGTWDDIARLHGDFRLMFDAVFNHISAQSAWFAAFLRGEAPYTDYFITVDPALDLSAVRRPRALPLLTPFQTASGEKHVWTTFSADQIDLNAANPDVLLELIRVLLFYVQKGADLIRLDAIAYLWKIIGTSCIHLEQTHIVIQLMRDVLDQVAPSVQLITETNVPHDENISYFGDGTNEAQMVYNFSLPPLLVHTFATGDTHAINQWADGLRRVSDQTTFFNFTASHDGIGVTPARGILSSLEIDRLVSLAEAHGGLVSYKNNSDGSRSPYELNITYFDAITHPALTARDPQTAAARFICSQAVMLAFMGVPGVYIHSLVGSRNWSEGVTHSGHNRTINRQKFEYDALQAELNTAGSLRASVYSAYAHLLRVRTSHAAFDPFGEQSVLDLHPGVFALRRTSPDGQHNVLALHNVRGETAVLRLPDSVLRRDLLTGEVYQHEIALTPYQVVWLSA